MRTPKDETASVHKHRPKQFALWGFRRICLLSSMLYKTRWLKYVLGSNVFAPSWPTMPRTTEILRNYDYISIPTTLVYLGTKTICHWGNSVLTILCFVLYVRHQQIMGNCDGKNYSKVYLEFLSFSQKLWFTFSSLSHESLEEWNQSLTNTWKKRETTGILHTNYAENTSVPFSNVKKMWNL